MPPATVSETAVPPSAESIRRLRAVFYLRVSSKSQVRTDYNPEGISLPAQRVKCGEKAESINVDVVDEYVEPGASAYKDLNKRQAFLAMISRIEAHRDVDIVIVYQLNRFARDRYEDADFTMRLRNLGVLLVSATENIDETPSGELLHGIMAAINQYQSAASGKDIAYKMTQKASNGGTPGLAPIGYLNVRIRTEGRNIADVALDPDRWRLVQWAFEEFATGKWTISTITEELTHRGLTNRAAGKRPERPLNKSHVHKMLTNKYYVGVVTFSGVEYPNGRHPTFVTPAVFDRVSAILRARDVAGEKPQHHFHPLKGSLFCGHCGSRFGITNATGRHGGTYPYFYCLGRQRGKCRQPYVLISTVEHLVEEWWRRVEITPRHKARIRELVVASAQSLTAHGAEQAARQKKAITDLEHERRACMRAYYNDAITEEFLKEEQTRIDRALSRARETLALCEGEWRDLDRVLDQILALCEDSYTLYRTAPATVKRQLNQAVFHRFWIFDRSIGTADLQPPLAQLLAKDLGQRLATETKNLINAQRTPEDSETVDPHSPTGSAVALAYGDTRPHSGQTDTPPGTHPDGVSLTEGQRSHDQDSNMTTLVELRGFEPLTLTLPV
ncbi:recombinase family protein [Frankia sp. R43]|uniref:recombinase family protein n=1 Tax=Frankia sp. R43 TaxID=269536 RepID=UPI00350EAEB3